jgi:cell division septation protein DedD
MKIARYIADLLFEYECVVIPGLGGFITRNHPASINPVKNQFKPPWKEIVFNPHLRTNDGLLLNHIALSERLTYQEAKNRIDRFVLKCLNEMQKGRRISFKSIGSLYMNEQQVLMFDADESQNYLASSFGLGTFVSHPIARSTFNEKAAPAPTSESHEPEIHPVQKDQSRKHRKESRPSISAEHRAKRPVAQRKSGTVSRQLRFLGLLSFALFIGWVVMNKATVQHYYSSYASLVPFFYASPNEYLVNNLDKLPVQKYLSVPLGNKAAKDDKVMLQPTGNNLQQVSNPIPVEDLYVQPQEEAPQEEVPFNDLTVNDASVDKTTVEEIVPVKPKTETKQVLEKTLPVTVPVQNQNSVETPKKEGAKVSKTDENLTARFYIIGGAFRDETNAEKLMSKLRSKGYSPVYAGRTRTGLLRVSYVALNDHAEAIKRLQQIQKEEDQGAWLMSL